MNLIEVQNLTSHFDERAKQTIEQLTVSTICPSTLFKLLQSDSKDPDLITDIISISPDLSARLITIVNSAAMGISRHIFSLKQAVNLLGASRARSLGLAHGLHALVQINHLPTHIAETLWTSAITKAYAARTLCAVLDQPRIEEAYCHGLIQDIGLPMLVAVDLDFYNTQMITVNGNLQWLEMEQQHFGLDHTQVGQLVMAQWHASEQLQNTILHHHDSPTEFDDTNVHAILDISTFFASLIPHWEENSDENQQNWLNAIYAKFLKNHFASPDQLIQNIYAESHEIIGNTHKLNNHEQQQLTQRLINEVAHYSAGMVAAMYTLEHSLTQKHSDLEEMRYQAFTDELTGILNRRGFMDLAQQHVQQALEEHTGLCCILIDLDDFKNLNDTSGHEAGDLMLQAIAKLMQSSIRDNDILGRIGGDEFAILISNVNQQLARQLTDDLLNNTEGQHLRLAYKVETDVHLSMGAAYFSYLEDNMTVDDLLNAADMAMYVRKDCGKRGLNFATIIADDTTNTPQKTNPKSIIRNPTRD